MMAKILPFLTLIVMGLFGICSALMPLNLGALLASFVSGLITIAYLHNGFSLRKMVLLLGQTLAFFSLALIAGLTSAENTIPFTGVFIAIGFLIGLWFAENLRLVIRLLASTFLIASCVVQLILFPSPQYLSLGIPLLVIGSVGLSLSRVLKW